MSAGFANSSDGKLAMEAPGCSPKVPTPSGRPCHRRRSMDAGGEGGAGARACEVHGRKNRSASKRRALSRPENPGSCPRAPAGRECDFIAALAQHRGWRQPAMDRGRPAAPGPEVGTRLYCGGGSRAVLHKDSLPTTKCGRTGRSPRRCGKWRSLYRSGTSRNFAGTNRSPWVTENTSPSSLSFPFRFPGLSLSSNAHRFVRQGSRQPRSRISSSTGRSASGVVWRSCPVIRANVAHSAMALHIARRQLEVHP